VLFAEALVGFGLSDLQSVSIRPPSTRTEAPVVADANGEDRYVTIFAISSTLAAR
jgi:hypothetical protein